MQTAPRPDIEAATSRYMDAAEGDLTRALRWAVEDLIQAERMLEDSVLRSETEPEKQDA